MVKPSHPCPIRSTPFWVTPFSTPELVRPLAAAIWDLARSAMDSFAWSRTAPRRTSHPMAVYGDAGVECWPRRTTLWSFCEAPRAHTMATSAGSGKQLPTVVWIAPGLGVPVPEAQAASDRICSTLTLAWIGRGPAHQLRSCNSTSHSRHRSAFNRRWPVQPIRPRAVVRRRPSTRMRNRGETLSKAT